MPIDYKIFHENNYYIAKYTGQLTDDEFINYWTQFYNSGEWSHEYNSLTDLSELDATKITNIGIVNFVELNTSVRKNSQSGIRKIAIYSPNLLPFGLARMFENFANESLLYIEVFRNIEEALEFIKS